MFTKKQRITSWLIMAIISVIVGGTIAMFAEIFLPGGWFYIISTVLYAFAALLSVAAMFLSLSSLAINDWNESISTKNLVNLGHNNDHVISIYRLRDAIVHLPVAGTVHQAIIAPNNAEIPYVAGETLEHIHFGNQIPQVEIMDDELYRKLFGPSNKKEK